MPTYTVVDQSNGDFKECFELRCDATAIPPGEADYVAALRIVLHNFSQLRASRIAADSAEMARVEQRSAAALILRRDAEQFCAGNLKAADALRGVDQVMGKYRREQLASSLFSIAVISKQGKATDLVVGVRSMEDVTIPPDRQALFVDLTSALTVVNTACDRMDPTQESARTIALRDEFIRKLADCGTVGLCGSHTGLAEVALATLKEEFFSRYATALKKSANDRLAVWAFGAAAVFAAAYFACRWLIPLGTEGDVVRQGYATNSFLYAHRAIFLLVAGAAVGTWLSFSIRNLDLTFADLGKFDAEFIGPGVRVLFVVVLAVVVALLFWTGAFALKVGGLAIDPRIGGGTAMLVGVFCGLSERALASAVLARAGTFVRGIAGSGAA